MKAKKSLVERTKINPSLMELVHEFQGVQAAVVESEGELTPELERRLEVNSQMLLQKVDGYAHIDEQLEMQADYFKAKAKRFAEIGERFRSARERLRDRVKQAMVEMGKDEVKGHEFRYKLQNCKQSLEIDPSLVPEQFKMIVTTTAIDKEKIRAALTDGLDVPGARLEGGKALRIYENTGD